MRPRRRSQPGQPESGESQWIDAHARESRRFSVAADGIKASTVNRLFEEEPDQKKHAEYDHWRNPLDSRLPYNRKAHKQFERGVPSNVIELVAGDPPAP